MKEELLQIKQDIIDISNDLKTNLADKGVTADGTLSELVESVQNIDSNVLAEIGWNLSEQPYLKDAIDYTKEIQLNPKSSYQNDKRLVIFPKVDELVLKNYMFNNSNLSLFPDGVKLTGSLYSAFAESPIQHIDLSGLGNITDNMYGAFWNCKALSTITTNNNFGKGVTNMQYLFSNCSSLSSPITLDVSSCTDMYYAFNTCSIPYIKITGDPTNITNTSGIFSNCTSLTYLSIPEDFPLTNSSGHLGGIIVPKIYGSFDYSKCTDYSSSYYKWVCYFTQNNHTRYMVIKNLGYKKDASYLNMEYSRVWGIANDEVPDAKQSLIDSLITYSYDRVTAGYSTMTMKLYADVKALLTEDEIAQITAKGYTLV